MTCPSLGSRRSPKLVYDTSRDPWVGTKGNKCVKMEDLRLSGPRFRPEKKKDSTRSILCTSLVRMRTLRLLTATRFLIPSTPRIIDGLHNELSDARHNPLHFVIETVNVIRIEWC